MIIYFISISYGILFVTRYEYFFFTNYFLNEYTEISEDEFHKGRGTWTFHDISVLSEVELYTYGGTSIVFY